MSDEDSRECPSQEVGEVLRDDVYNMGIDERRGSMILQTHKVLHCKPFMNQMTGMHRRKNKAFRERRDSNSFDSHDCK